MSAPSGVTTNEQIIYDLLIKYQEAVKDKNLIQFLSIYDVSITVYDMWNVWSYKGLEEWRGMAEGWFSSLGEEVDTVQFSETVVEAGQDMATLYTMVKYTAFSMDGIELRSLNNRMTWVLKRKDDQWKVIHEHSSSPGNLADASLMLEK